METDPIRDALEAAALEISALHLEWDGDPPEVWDCHRHMAAAAVAAFLRILSRQHVEACARDGVPGDPMGVGGWLDSVADDVERAAKEGA